MNIKNTDFSSLLELAKQFIVLEQSMTLSSFCKKYNCDKSNFSCFLNQQGIIFNKVSNTWNDQKTNNLQPNSSNHDDISENSNLMLANYSQSHQNNDSFDPSLLLQRFDSLEQKVHSLETRVNNIDPLDFHSNNNGIFLKDMEEVLKTYKKLYSVTAVSPMFCFRVNPTLALELRTFLEDTNFSNVEGMNVMIKHYLNMYNQSKETR